MRSWSMSEAGLARLVRLAGAWCLLASLAACGGEGAGAGGSLLGVTQSGPSSGSNEAGVGEITVTSAVPTSGLGRVLTDTGVVRSSQTAGQTALVITGQVADGSTLHRFVVEVEPGSGSVQSVTHAWGSSLNSPEAVVQCVRIQTNPTALVQLCGDTVRVVPATGQVTFNATPLKSGSYQSVLTGVAWTTPF